MTAAAPLFEPVPIDAPASVEALARALIEPQLQMLARLAGAGVEIAVALERHAKGEAEVPAAQGDIALAYARVSRAVRLSLALQTKLLEDLKALEDARTQAAAAAGTEREELRSGLEYARKVRVQRIVDRIVTETPDKETGDTLYREACDRLDDFDRYDELLSRPFSEIIDVLCRDIGIPCDWSRLCEEGWARAEIDSGAPGAPLTALGLAPRPRPPGAPPRPSVAELDARFLADMRRLDRKPDDDPPIPAKASPKTSPWESVTEEKRGLAEAQRALAERPDDS